MPKLRDCARWVFVLSVAALLPSQAALAQAPPAGVPSAAGVDTRLGIVTRPNERAHILNNMRTYLSGLQQMADALARDDMKAAAQAARSMGSINLYEVRLAFPSKPAVEFRELAFSLQREFDRIAKDAEDRKDPRQTLGQVAGIMQKCVQCHATYRLMDMAHSGN